MSSSRHPFDIPDQVETQRILCGNQTIGRGVDIEIDAWLEEGSKGFQRDGHYYSLTGEHSLMFSEMTIRNGLLVAIRVPETLPRLIPASVTIKDGLHVGVYPNPNSLKTVNRGFTSKGELVAVIHNGIEHTSGDKQLPPMDMIVLKDRTKSDQHSLKTRIFISYSHADECHCKRLQVALQSLVQLNDVEVWCDQRMTPGTTITPDIQANLHASQIVILLVSPDFLASSYCMGVEVKTAMKLQESNTSTVVPVILRHCNWGDAPFASLLALPKDGRPVTAWPDQDEAIQVVLEGIKAVIKRQKTGTGKLGLNSSA